MKKEEQSGGSICGGIVKRSEFLRDPEAYMMAYIMRDREYNWYVAAKRRGDYKRAHYLSEKFAYSVI